jgi:hypothetical protein
MRSVTFLDYQHNKRVGIGLARTPHPLEIIRPGQTEISLHPRLLSADLPANLFYVFVHCNGQLMATAQTAALEYSTPVSSGHTLAETMYTDTAANFRLIRSFWHSFFLVSKIIAVPI